LGPSKESEGKTGRERKSEPWNPALARKKHPNMDQTVKRKKKDARKKTGLIPRTGKKTPGQTEENTNQGQSSATVQRGEGKGKKKKAGGKKDGQGTRSAANGRQNKI